MISFKTCMRVLSDMSRPIRWRMAVTILAGMVRITASLSFVVVSKLLVDIATGASAEPLGKGIAAFLGVLALQIGCAIFSNWWESYFEVKALNQMREALFARVMKSRWDGREKFLSGDTVNRLEEDIRVVAELLSQRVPTIILTLLQLIVASVYLLMLAPNLLWVLLILMTSTVVGSRLFFSRLRKVMAAIRSRESEIQQLMQESLLHRVLVLTLTNVDRVLDKFGWYQKDIENNTRKRLNYNAVARGLMVFGFQAGHAVAFLWGVFGIIHGTVTYGMMTAFLQLVGQVQRPIAELGKQVPAFIRAITSVERLIELRELEQEPQGERICLEGAPEIVVDRLVYAYPDQKTPILDNFSCVFPAGKMSAIAGPTGSGKSTLIRLILGLLKPASGSVRIGGEPAGSALRDNFMYIPQGNSLLSGTVRSNLLLANPKAGEDDIREALECAGAEFVYGLPEGLDSKCGEIGSGLSEGQAQRIAIARALLRPGGVMILDESTSALDSATELRVLNNLHERYHGRKTILFISHREAVINYADCTVELS